MKRTRRLLFAASLACVMSLGVMGGQQTPPPSKPPDAPPQSPPATQAQPQQGQEGAQRPTFRAEANYVRVDVYPTADGRPVMDLTQDEFQVLEDGVP